MNTNTENAATAERSRFHRIAPPEGTETTQPQPTNEVQVPKEEHADEIRVPSPVPPPQEHEYQRGTERPVPPVHPEPDYPTRPRNEVLAMPLGVQVALVPVDWLERLLSRQQIETVLERRQPPRRIPEPLTAESAPQPGKGNKFCAGCSNEKPVGDFYRMASAKDGYQPRCKDCQRKDATARREATAPDTSGKRGAYTLSGKARNTVRGRATIKKVFEYFKKHKTVTARQLTNELKIPPSTAHRVLASLQKKQAIARVARV
jgi:ribosomal protein S25